MRKSGARAACIAVAFWAASGARADDRRPLASHPTVATSPAAPARSHVTFSREIVRLLQTNCQGCHHDGGIAPFPLVTYEDAFAHRTQIQIVTATRRMPPFKADPSCASFEGDPRLAEADLRTFDAWVLSGAPEGDPSLLPGPLTFDDGWKLGEPDLALEMPQPFQPDFSTGDVYRCFRLPTGLETQRYLSAVEVAPGNRTMVHHVLLFADTSDASAALEGKDGRPGYPCFGGPGFTGVSPLGAWVPGFRDAFLPDGIGIDLPKGAPIVMQVHYSARTGGVAPDRTRVGLHFTSVPVQKRLLTLPLVNQTFRLPAGESAIPVTAAFGPVPYAITLWRIAPHMHLLGRRMSVSVTPFGSGAPRCLASVPDWDFRWQGFYAYRTPVKIPVLGSLALEAVYDNSADNPNNPNVPPKDVRWGEATSDEMCLCYLSFTLDAENLAGGNGQTATEPSSFDAFWERAWTARPVPR